MWLPVPGVPVSTFSVSKVFTPLNLLIELVLMMGRCGEARMFLKLCLKKIDRLRVVPHFSSGIEGRAKRERA